MPIAPLELRRLAGAALRRMHARPPGFEEDDLLNELLKELVECGPTSQDDLLSLEDDQLRAAVSNRLRQLAVEAAPDWDRYRALKGHVTAVLKEVSGPPADTAAPAQLTVGKAERLSRDRVRQAVAWALAAAPPPPREATPLTRLLMQRYFPPTGRDAQGLRDPRPSSAPRIRVDGAFLAAALRDELPHDQLQALVGTLESQSLTQIAAALDVAVATAWDLKQRAIVHIRALMARHGISTDRTVTVALRNLARDPRVRRVLGLEDP